MKTSSKVILAAIAGAAVGAVAGILLAPDKGEETRRKIAEKAKELAKKYRKGEHEEE